MDKLLIGLIVKMAVKLIFNEIVKITTQDSLLKLFNPQIILKRNLKEFQEREIKNSVGEKQKIGRMKILPVK